MTSELLQQAYDSYTSGNRKKAIDLLTQAIEANPEDVDAWYGMAICSKDTNFKIKCLRKVLQLNPNHEKAKQGLELLVPPSAEPIPNPQTGLMMSDMGGSSGITKTCPYCGAGMDASKTVCPVCFRPLSGNLEPNVSMMDDIDSRKTELAESEQKNADTLGIIALICGITGFCFVLPAIAAVIVGYMAKKKGSRMGNIGFWLGVVEISLSVCGCIMYFIALQALPGMMLRGFPIPTP